MENLIPLAPYQMSDDVEEFITKIRRALSLRLPGFTLKTTQAPVTTTQASVTTTQAPVTTTGEGSTQPPATPAVPTTPAVTATLTPERAILEEQAIEFFESNLSTTAKGMYHNIKPMTVATLEEAFDIFRRTMQAPRTPGSIARIVHQVQFNPSHSPHSFWYTLQHVAKEAPELTDDVIWWIFVAKIDYMYDKVFRRVTGKPRSDQLTALDQEYRNRLQHGLHTPAAPQVPNLIVPSSSHDLPPSTTDNPYPEVCINYKPSFWERLPVASSGSGYDHRHTPPVPQVVPESSTFAYPPPLSISTANATRGSFTSTTNTPITPFPGQPWADSMEQLANQMSQMAMYAGSYMPPTYPHYQHPYPRMNRSQNHAYHQAPYQSQGNYQARQNDRPTRNQDSYQSQMQGPNRGYRGGPSPSSPCRNCGDPGHWQRDCPRRYAPPATGSNTVPVNRENPPHPGNNRPEACMVEILDTEELPPVMVTTRSAARTGTRVNPIETERARANPRSRARQPTAPIVVAQRAQQQQQPVVVPAPRINSPAPMNPPQPQPVVHFPEPNLIDDEPDLLNDEQAAAPRRPRRPRQPRDNKSINLTQGYPRFSLTQALQDVTIPMSVPALLEISPRCRAELRKGLQHPPRPADQDEAAPIPEVDMNTVETLNEIPTAAFAPASIKGHHLEIILDSGAAHCCVPSALVKKLGLTINNRRRLFVKTANGIGTSDGQISLPIKLGGKEFLIHGVNVLPLVDYVLLGNAFLKGRAILDLRSYIADIDGAEPIPLRLEPHPQPRIQISSRPPPQRDDYHDYSESESDSEGDDEYFLDTYLADAVDLGPKIEGTINPDLSKEEFHELSALLQSFDLWANKLTDLGSYTELKHEILTKDSPPVRQGAYPTTPMKNEIIKKEIDQQLAAGVLRPSKSPWASPVSVIPKKDGGMRMCGDYRRLNAITIRDNYPIPRINDLLDALEGVQWISTLDAFSGYFQIEMKEEDKPKTAIISKFGLFEYNRLPFGLCNAPATFQRAMNNILHNYLGNCVLVYLDDIIIYSKGTLEEHLSHIATILATLEKNHIKLKPSKCHFAFQEVEYLGHVISNKGVRPIPEKTLAVKAFKTPKDVPQVKSFLGLSGYYRRYVPNYSRVALPLSKLTRKKVVFLWRQPQQYAFDELKDRLCSAPILAYPRYDLPFILQPDASAEALGAVLSQVNEDGEEHPIAYASCTLNSAQKNYTTTERECLAVVWAVEHFAQYLEQSSVVIQTDHAALKQLLTTKRPTGRIARWLYRLSPFNYTIENRPGRQHGNADALSRYPTDGAPYDEVIPFVDTHPVEPEEGVLTPGGLPDQTFQILKTSLENDAPLPLELSRKERRRINRLKNRCYLEQEIVWVDTKRGPRRLLPAAEFHHIMQEHHYAPTAGHGGLHNTVRRIQATYYWPGMYKDVKLALDHCPICIRQLPPVVRPLHPIRVNGAFERVSIDFIGPLPITLTGNRYILVAIDHLTKWVEAKALPTDDARITARFVLEEVICRHGCPEILQSDRGSHFRNHVLDNLTSMLQIRKKLSTAYHPQTNGLVERFNKTLKVLLLRLITQRDDCWDRYLAPALFAYRTMIQASTGSTPFYLTYGREARHPFDPNEPRVLEQPQWQEALQRRFLALINVIPNARQRAADLNRAAQEAQRRWHDQGRHFDGQGPIPDGTVVMKLPPPNVLAPFANPRWEGPFIITRSYGNGTYQLRTLAGADLGRINGNQLRELRSFPPRFVQQHAPQLVV